MEILNFDTKIKEIRVSNSNWIYIWDILREPIFNSIESLGRSFKVDIS